MKLTDLSSPDAVLAAISEFDRIGRDEFLSKYGFGRSREYFVVHGGRLYDSKAIAGAAIGFQFPAEGPLRSEEFSGGESTVQRTLEGLGFEIRREDDLPGEPVGLRSGELTRRERMWERLNSLGDPQDVSSATIGEIGIRPPKTGQGIYRDLDQTRGLAPSGVTLSLLDLGASYRDEFDERGGIYHYPRTNRSGRDQPEIDATKAASRMGLPVFVVLASNGPNGRAVKKAWVADFDDEASTFYVTFDAPEEERELEEREKEEVFTKRKLTTTRAKARPGQAKFRFRVLKRYGVSCALCGLGVKEVLEAAHIVSVEDGGSDHPGNGLVLCRNHHRAFDERLVSIHPGSLEIRTKPGGPDTESLQVTQKTLAGTDPLPLPEALRWHWEKASSGWKTSV